MMYTGGIRKIFNCTIKAKSRKEAENQAEAVGYKALSFNGVVFVKVEEYGDWHETCFRVTDFSDGQV